MTTTTLYPTNSTSTTTVNSTDVDDDSNWKVIVGGVVGGVLGLAAVIALAVFTFVYVRTRKRRQEGRYRPATEELRQKKVFTIPLPNPEKLI